MTNKPFIIDSDKELIIVEKDYCEKHILVLVTINYLTLHFNEDGNNYTFYKDELCDIFNGLGEKFALKPDDNLEQKEREEVINEFGNKLPYFTEMNEVLAKCKKYKGFNNAINFVDYLFRSEEILKEAFEILSEYVKLNRKFYTLVDLIAAKKDILKSLSYIVSPQELSDYELQYSRAIEELNTSKLKELLELSQKKILQHWEIYLTSPNDYVSGGPFRFLCHSVYKVFSGKFKSNIISMSLLTDKLFDCFANEFGFILPPTNIIGADSSDMYVNNLATVDSDLLSYTTINKISTPERLEEECCIRKSQFKEEIVYNEVAKRVFDPIGIFCLTDGSKNINFNYQNAHLLKENFPYLEIIEIDKTKYIKNRSDFLTIIIDLINGIRNYSTYDSFFNYSYLDIKRLASIGAYDDFFHDFMELKKKINFDENEIMELYKKYEYLLFGNFSFDKIFDCYSFKEIKFILKYNKNLGVGYIIFGKKEKDFIDLPLNFRFEELSKIYSVYKGLVGKINLNDFIPGLADFLVLYPRSASFDKMIKLQMCACSCFWDINSIIVNQMNSKELEKTEYKDIVSKYLPRQLPASDNDIDLAIPAIELMVKTIKDKTESVFDYINAIIMLSFNDKYKNARKNIAELQLQSNTFLSLLKNRQQDLVEYGKEKACLSAELEGLNDAVLDEREKIKAIKDRLLKIEENIAYLEYKIEYFKEQLQPRRQKINEICEGFREKTGYDYKYYDENMISCIEKKYRIPVVQELESILAVKTELMKILARLGLTYGMLSEYQNLSLPSDEDGKILKKI